MIAADGSKLFHVVVREVREKKRMLFVNSVGYGRRSSGLIAHSSSSFVCSMVHKVLPVSIGGEVILSI